MYVLRTSSWKDSCGLFESKLRSLQVKVLGWHEPFGNLISLKYHRSAGAESGISLTHERRGVGIGHTKLDATKNEQRKKYMRSPSLFHVGGESEHDCQSHEEVENKKFHC